MTQIMHSSQRVLISIFLLFFDSHSMPFLSIPKPRS